VKAKFGELKVPLATGALACAVVVALVVVKRKRS
jgi:hypothetical protein